MIRLIRCQDAARRAREGEKDIYLFIHREREYIYIYIYMYVHLFDLQYVVDMLGGIQLYLGDWWQDMTNQII